MRLLRTIGMGVLACFLQGCIVVEDFGDYWHKGFTDHCINNLVADDMRREDGAEARIPAMRSLRLGNQRFLMIREHEGDQGGNLVRYAILNGEYVSYRLREDKREDFLRHYPNSPVVLTSETATIPLLNDETAQLLSHIGDDESYWIESSRQPYNPTHRSDCIQLAP